MQYKSREIQAGFDRAAASYDKQAALQNLVSKRAAGRAATAFPGTARVLDIGCGTGSFGRYASAHAPAWEVIGLDLSLAMCRKSQAVQGNWQLLPFADATFDAVFSSLTLQWINDSAMAFAEAARVLKPGSRAMIATLGAGTLRELRESFRAAGDGATRVHEFPATKTWRQQAKGAGFTIESYEKEAQVLLHPDVATLLDSIRAIGAANRDVRRPQRFSRRETFTRMEQAYCERFGTEKGIPSTWNVLYFVVKKRPRAE